MNHVKPAYIRTSEGNFLVQLPADNEWGFVLANEHQEWPGGLGAAPNWEVVPDNQVPLETRERMDWMLVIGD